MRVFIGLFAALSIAWSSQYDAAIAPLKNPTLQTAEQRNPIILESYKEFQKTLKASKYYTEHTTIYNNESEAGYVHPVLEYYAFLTSHSGDVTVAETLDYLIQTAGPFGFSTRKANAAEQFIYDIAGRAIARTQRRAIVESENPAEQTAYQKVMTQQPGVTFALPTRQERWKALIDLVQNPNFFNQGSLESMRIINKTQTPRYFFTNDLFLLGFSLGLTNRLKGTSTLFKEWEMDDTAMERQHNYVQVWFPNFAVGLGDGITSPRLTPTLLRNLRGTQCFTLLQQMNRITWSRMATFWGQKTDPAAQELILTSQNQHNNWVTPHAGTNYNHNNSRMTRILIWLRTFCMNDEHELTSKYLIKTAKASPSPKASLPYWVGPESEPDWYAAELARILP